MDRLSKFDFFRKAVTNFAVPLSVIVVDFGLRRRVSSLWGGEEWLYFAISVLFSILLYQVVLFSARKLCRKATGKWRVAVPAAIGLIYSIVVLGSYGYFLNNGILPNYYTIQYLIDNPYNSFTLLSDSIRWFYAPAFLAVFYFFYYCVKSGIWSGRPKSQHNKAKSERLKNLQDVNDSIIPKRKWLSLRIIGRFVFGGLFIFLILFFNNNIRFYDQCAVADANIFSISLRTLTDRLFGVDKGNAGLSSRIPPKMDFSFEHPGYNVLFIVCESLRPQSMQVYGYERATTPFLDSLSSGADQELFVVDRAFTNASTTVVSLPSLFSGIAQYQPAGILYRSPLFWDYARSCGYPTFFISSHDHDWYHLSVFFTGAADYYWNKRISGNPRYNDLGIDDRLTVQEFENHTEQILRSGNQFAGVLHFNTNHLPYTTPADFYVWQGDSKDDYDNSVLLQDHYFSAVFDFLSRQKALSNTIVVITSDHGQAFREHNYIGHLECNYIETISVPMILYIPRGLQTRFNINNLRSNLGINHSLIDMIPTFLTIFGIESRPELSEYTVNYHGKSLFSSPDSLRDIIICNSHEISESNVGLSLVRGNYHYLLRTNTSPVQEELYEFHSDPWEKSNLWPSLADSAKEAFRSPFAKYDATKSIIKLHK